MKRIVLLSSVLYLFVHVLNAQIVTDEQPTGLTLVQSSISRNANIYSDTVQILSAPNRVTINIEDSIADSQPGPLRFACPVQVNYTLYNSGTWQVLANGDKLWKLKVKLPGALSTNALYDKFWLPEGGKFFVYSEETEQYIGAVTSEYIGGSYEEPAPFATALIYGESAVFEYYQPASVSDSAVISISRIDYGYRFVNNPNDNILQSFGDAGNCQVNINCSEGNNWQTEKHAVARVSVVGPEGSGWCSCALVNNTANDYTPYVLTANHCLEGLDAVTNNNAGQWIFYWEYEHSGCTNSSTQPTLRTTLGATIRANNSVSDFALLQLTQDPRNSGIAPYYLGWDRTGNSGTGGIGIHHPRGDVKKISTSNQIQNQSTQITISGNVCQSNTHWKVVWNTGTTESGSSGSPFIDNNHRIIGQLHGGNASCTALTQPDYYGKFNVSWNGTGTSTGATDNRRRLNYWLDPAGLSVETLNGLEGFSLSGSDFICPNSNETYTIQNKPATATVTWTSNAITLSSANNTTGNSAVFHYSSGGAGNYIYNSGNNPVGYYHAWIQATLHFTNGQTYALPQKYITQRIVSKGNYTQYDIPSATNRMLLFSNPYVSSSSYPITIKLFADPQISYSWSIINTTGSTSPYIYTQNNGAIAEFNPTSGNTYQLTVSATICGTSQSYTYEFYPDEIDCTSTYNQGSGILEITFGNPSVQGRTVSSVTASVYYIRIFDLYGNLIKEEQSSGETASLNLSSLRKAIYVVAVYNNSTQIYSKTFVK
jgi:hypothetical protein